MDLLDLILLVLGIIAILTLFDLAAGLLQEIDKSLDYTISDFIKNVFDTGSKIIKTILHKK